MKQQVETADYKTQNINYSPYITKKQYTKGDTMQNNTTRNVRIT
jgi:hypothetical protein